jgi:hypothetical protein
MNDNEEIIPISWTRQREIHQTLCDRINLPKKKSRKLYITRKMTLTRWYNKYGLAKAAQMAGHVVGARAMKHYVALSESDLITDKTETSIERKICPNPNCQTENDASETQCHKCKSPLNKKAFAQILNQNLDEKINSQLELIKKDFLIKMLTINQQQTTQEIITSPSR